jgi:hypothetical protein
MDRSGEIAVLLAADMKSALEQAAAADNRSVSNLVERILRAWLEGRGLLK